MKFFGVVGWKNSGKTGLVERLVREMVARGLSVSTIKHAHHSFDVDHPGRDSHRHRLAGASQVMLSSRKRWALMTEHRAERPEAEFRDLASKLDKVDIVLVEGFKSQPIHKIEAHRHATGQPLLALKDTHVLAVASDQADLSCKQPVFELNDTRAIADFILAHVGLTRTAPRPTAGLEQDCFALPPGVDWVPVDAALAQLRSRLRSVVEGQNLVPVAQAAGRVLADDAKAMRASPPLPNTAVDGYGFAAPQIEAGQSLSFDLLDGHAGPGAPFKGVVRAGQAVRVLTGGPLPAGVQTVAWQEHVRRQGGRLHVNGPLKSGENTRKAGEDLMAGDVILPQGRVLAPQDLALLTSGGLGHVPVRPILRVGVLSTGNELTKAAPEPDAAQIFDANRPMLLSMVRAWGYEAVDLGICADDRFLISKTLSAATDQVDVLITSGGASAGDEDFLADVLAELGKLHSWRIAIKPGRPLAMGQIGPMAVFGLPGNPVAAFVCALLFARPALAVLSGADWPQPQGFMVPAGFSKSKKAGRREYLRARMDADGHVQRFQSEGSGRVSGLSWADGLVELPDQAMAVSPGDMVRFLPYGSFGLNAG